MNEFRASFRAAAQAATKGMAVPARLELGEDRDLLVLPKQNDGGFEAQIECFDYGAYPSAGGWHSGCWDVTASQPEEMAADIKEFVASVLSDAVLQVRYSNSKPYKWRLHYQFQGKRIWDETGVLFFNWFGSRSERTFCNGAAT